MVPDGTTLAFSVMFDAPPLQIYTIRADGTGLSQLTHGDPHASQPVWSPDGKRIAYVSTPRDGSVGDAALFVMAMDGGQRALITDEPGIRDLLAWLPEGVSP